MDLMRSGYLLTMVHDGTRTRKFFTCLGKQELTVDSRYLEHRAISNKTLGPSSINQAE